MRLSPGKELVSTLCQTQKVWISQKLLPASLYNDLLSGQSLNYLEKATAPFVHEPQRFLDSTGAKLWTFVSVSY